MKDQEEWHSPHEDYFIFAKRAAEKAAAAEIAPSGDVYLEQGIIDAIRYSYDCLEATIEFVRNMLDLGQFRNSIPANWLTRYTRRQWRKASLADKIGLLTYCVVSDSFWQSKAQLDLFNALRHIRDQLTHVKPYSRTFAFDPIAPGMAHRRLVKTDIDLGLDAMRIFNRTVSDLTAKDARLAFEILVCHLSRFEQLFIRQDSTWFAYFDTARGVLVPISTLKTTCTYIAPLWDK